jgi:hypothetical protein
VTIMSSEPTLVNVKCIFLCTVMDAGKGVEFGDARCILLPRGIPIKSRSEPPCCFVLCAVFCTAFYGFFMRALWCASFDV